MYWENPPGFSKPAYLDLCLETIQKHLGAFELKLLDERSVTDYIALPKTIRHPALPLDRKADYIRYALLYEYGGVWFDCDLILLRDVDALVTPGLEQSGFVLFAEIGGGGGGGELLVQSNVLASVRRHAIVKDALSAMRRATSCTSVAGLESRLKYLIKKHLLRTAPNPPLGVEKGPAMFRRILPQHAHYAHPIRRGGLSWTEHEAYYREVQDLTPYLRDRPFLFNLYHSGGMGEALKHKTRAQLLSGRSLLSQIFRLSLGEGEI